MKTRVCLSSALLFALLASSGCAKENPAAPRAADAVAPAAPTAPAPAAPEVVTPAPQLDPITEMSVVLDSSTFKDHAGLSNAQVRMDRTLSDQVAASRAAGHTASVEADEKFNNARRDFAEKLRVLTLTTEESWPNAKHNTAMALQDVRVSYGEIMNPVPEKQN